MSNDRPQDVADAIDALGDTPTPDDVYHATREYDARYIASAAASEAKAGGGGGSLPEEWSVDAAGALTINLDGLSADFPNALIITTDSGGKFLIYADGGGDLDWHMLEPNAAVNFIDDVNGGNALAIGSSAVSVNDQGGAAMFSANRSNGDVAIGGAGGQTIASTDTKELGFFGVDPTGRQAVPLTTPSVQNVIDGLVALGLFEQHD